MKRWILGLVGFAVIASLLFYYKADKQQLYHDLTALAVDDIAFFEVIENPIPAPQTKFQDREGKPVSFSDFRGKTLLVNFWATWCAPCLYEMPSLNRLQKALGGDGFEVITISLDRQGYDVIDPFFEKTQIDALQAYLDRSNKLTLEVGAIGLPTSILIDKNGRLITRMVGPVEWDKENALRFISRALQND